MVSLPTVPLGPGWIAAKSFYRHWNTAFYRRGLEAISIATSAAPHFHRPTLPPPQEQRRIVAILDEVFKGIDTAIVNQRRKLGLLEMLKQSILQKAFSGELTAHPEKALPEAAE